MKNRQTFPIHNFFSPIIRIQILQIDQHYIF